MRIIKLLDEETINQISAGEVIERPASVVKELVENAIDAGATKISITVKNAGQSLIEIDDNGNGISREDLAVALLRHTTSKLQDINEINTLGFRGEALSSIAAIARIKIETRNADDTHGWAIEASSGKIEAPAPCARNAGTKITVRDLFFATPARLRFMKSEATERSHIESVLEKIALSHPTIAFHISNDKTSKNFRPGTHIERITEIIGSAFTESAMPIEIYKDNHGATGWISKPTYTRASYDGLFIYVNSRPIRDRAIQAIVKSAYGDVIPRDRFPAAVIFLSVPHSDIDVNVHPAKTEVRFKDISIVRDMLFSGIKTALATGRRHELVSNIEYSEKTPAHFPVYRPQNVLKAAESSGAFSYNREPELIKVSPREEIFGEVLCQAHNSYIITQKSDGIMIIDQHAAHERITYEKLKSEFSDGGPVTIQQISPGIEIHCKMDDAMREQLGKIGFCISGDPAILSAAPSIFKCPEHAAQAIAESVASNDSLRDRILANIACKQSIKFGRRLSLYEMHELLDQLAYIPNFDRCNHGRPVYIIIPLTELLSKFDRN